MIRPLRVTMGLLLGAESALAIWMTTMVWEVTRDASLFPSPTRHPISVGGLIAGTSLIVYCALLGFVMLANLGKMTSLQQQLRRRARRVHVAVGAVACVVWLWTFPVFDAAGILATIGLMIISLAWSQLIIWTLAPRRHESDSVRNGYAGGPHRQ